MPKVFDTVPILTIAIPTWNRASILDTLLKEIQIQRKQIKHANIELLVCDNYSSDDTADIVASHQISDFNIRYVRHIKNLGSDMNIASCHNLAHGDYVWILSDDDMPIKETLSSIIPILNAGELGLLYLKAYGFSDDMIAEYPKSLSQGMRVVSHFDDFLNLVGANLTLISAIIYKKILIADIDAKNYCGNNLVQANLYLGAGLKSQKFGVSRKYFVAYRKTNIRNYDFSSIFVQNLHSILLDWENRGMLAQTRHCLERRMLIQFFPQEVLRLRLNAHISIKQTRIIFTSAYREYAIYWFFIDPIFFLPRWVALLWGYFTVIIGRTISGDLMRGLYYLGHKIKNQLFLRTSKNGQ